MLSLNHLMTLQSTASMRDPEQDSLSTDIEYQRLRSAPITTMNLLLASNQVEACNAVQFLYSMSDRSLKR